MTHEVNSIKGNFSLVHIYISSKSSSLFSFCVYKKNSGKLIKSCSFEQGCYKLPASRLHLVLSIKEYWITVKITLNYFKLLYFISHKCILCFAK